MPLNEDELKVEFEKWWSKHGEFVRSGGGDYEKCFSYAAFKAAYSPEVLQALGVVLCDAEPVAEVVDSKLADFMPPHQKVEWHRTEFAVGTKFHAIKEQS